MTDALIGTDFSEREIEILSLLADGLSNREIADRTGITLYTVKWYLKQLYSKLYVNNRTQAATKARELGLLEDSTADAGQIVNNLPHLLTPFLGRQEELQQLQQVISDDAIRLITIHGLGGMGKTRLALEAAQRFSLMFPDGVFFIPFAQVHGDPLRAIGETLKLQLDNHDSSIDALATALYGKKCLFVLDNFEHLAQKSPYLVDLLRHVPDLKILVTSRELLHIQGEYVFRLGGLTVPDSLVDLEKNGAYLLFLQRAHMVDASFTPTRDEQASIALICKGVGGMPLAIELAAGWTAVLSVHETLKRLQKSLDLLASDEQDRPERQQSVRATFDYSWSMLSPDVQDTLTSLGVFDVTGFTFAAAEKIAGATPTSIKQLRDAAIIQATEDRHFVFHPLIRQFVTERLQADEVLYHEVAEKYGQYYFDFVVEHNIAFRESIDLRVIKSFFGEAFQLDIAWLYVLSKERYDWLLQAVEVGYMCDIVSLWSEVDHLFAQTLTVLPKEHDLLRGRLLAFRAIFAFRFNNLNTLREYAQTSWNILHDTPYALDAGAAMAYCAIGETFLGDPNQAFALLEQIEGLLEREDLGENAYARLIISAARPIALYFAGHNDKALPLLEQIEAPAWHDLHIHLCECYISLNRMDEAREALEALYNAALDSSYYKSAMSSAFYLSIIDSSLEELPDNVVRACIELTQISSYRPIIAQIAHYQGTQLMMRGHHAWGKLLLRGNLHMLHLIGEPFLMYRFAFRTARLMQKFQPEDAEQLFEALLNDSQCPQSVRDSVAKHLKRGASAKPIGDLILGTFDDVLLR